MLAVEESNAWINSVCRWVCYRGCELLIKRGWGRQALCKFACRRKCGRGKRQAIDGLGHVTPIPANFDFYDLDDDNFIEINEFAATLGEDVNEPDLVKGFILTDVNGDGKLTREEFSAETCVFYKDGQLYCSSTWDNFSCWPVTPAGHTAVIPCPVGLPGVDHTQNATRHCMDHGEWMAKVNYDPCIMEDEPLPSEANRIIYYVGFCVSLIALTIALVIFLYFRSLRCLRNVIHSHLIVSFILRNLCWIIMDKAMLHMYQVEHLAWLCKLIVAIYNYLQETNFFWMFVEGLYLHTIIVWTYSAEKIRLWFYIVIGWGLPVVFVVAWCVVKAKLENNTCWLNAGTSVYDFVHITPILLVLFINIIFLASIIWVLVTKLRASQSLEAMQYKKVVRATVILLPLLGLTYVIFITPLGNDKVSHAVFGYFNAFLQSFQGFFVAVFYCFLNGEVRSVIRKRFRFWQDNRSITTRYTRASFMATQGAASCVDTTKNEVSVQIPLVNGRIDNNSNGFNGTKDSSDTVDDSEQAL
ncbi:corticotropin-releasing factor receptor 1-like [Liolophura sinensis]|uniref:corticotropin-releasing factor receptor 1-like n=1 Tax=Liolophura sinensis TaxID=3198878 RepID=UPI00315896B8